MSIEKLDHVNLRTTQLGAMIDWYGAALGLQPGRRPDFPFPGAWLYAGNTVVLHLIGIDGPPGAGSERGLKLEHFAFSARDIASVQARLQTMGEPYQRVELLTLDLAQLNLWDPDGNHLHLDFPSDEPSKYQE